MIVKNSTIVNIIKEQYFTNMSSYINYKTLGFGERESEGKHRIYAKVMIDGNEHSVDLDVPETVTKINYLQPSELMVAPCDEENSDAPIILPGYTRAGILFAIKLGISPDYRAFRQSELDRYFALGNEPVTGYNWNAELYRSVVKLTET